MKIDIKKLNNWAIEKYTTKLTHRRSIAPGTVPARLFTDGTFIFLEVLNMNYLALEQLCSVNESEGDIKAAYREHINA